MSSVEAGVRLLESGSWNEAVALLEALRDDPASGPDALHVLGLASAHVGDAARALELLEEAVARDPDNLERRANLGALALELDRPERALIELAAVAEQKPGEPGAHSLLGQALAQVHRYEEAVSAHEHAVALAPKDAELWSNLAGTYLAWGKLEAAEAGFAYAVSLAPENPDLHFNLGGAWSLAGKVADAEGSFRRALALRPDHARARTSLGVVLRAAGDAQGGLKEQERAFTDDPHDLDVRWNLALGYLSDGRWASGWALYEARRLRMPRLAREGAGEAWDGRPRPGSTLIVECEQGLGDTLLFARFLPAARDRVGRLVFWCQHSLTRLLEENLRVGDVTIESCPSEPCASLYAPLMSLPHLLGVGGDLGGLQPYLSVPEDRRLRWAARLGPKRSAVPRIGLVWQGNPGYANDVRRSVPLAAFEPLLSLAGIEVISLQQVHGLEQLDALPARLRPRVLEGPLDAEGAFLDTAAIMTELDFVVTVDTAPAHLAGALGIPTGLVLNAVPDWRWGQGSRVWYPSVAAFQPRGQDDMTSAIDRLVKHITERFELTGVHRG